jgi:hypothetical protein
VGILGGYAIWMKAWGGIFSMRIGEWHCIYAHNTQTGIYFVNTIFPTYHLARRMPKELDADAYLLI